MVELNRYNLALGLLALASAGKIRNARARMVEEMDRWLFAHAIESAHGNQARAARWLGVTRRTMRQKLACQPPTPLKEPAPE